MPTYDLTCSACGEKTELFLMRVIRDEDKVCPSCGSPGMKPGVGGGFLGAGTKRAATQPNGCPGSEACASGGG